MPSFPKYARILRGIMDSSIAANTEARHIFMDMLVLSDSHGNLDMTNEAFMNRTGNTKEAIERAFTLLSSADPKSTTTECDGRRIIPLDKKGWGWHIVNYEKYSGIQKHRNSSITSKNRKVNNDSVQDSVQNEEIPFRAYFSNTQAESKEFQNSWVLWVKYREEEKRCPLTDVSAKIALRKLDRFSIDVQLEAIQAGIINNYRGIFPESVRVTDIMKNVVSENNSEEDGVITENEKVKI